MRQHIMKLTLAFLLAAGLWPMQVAASDAGVVAGAKVGAGFGQPFGPFGASFVPELELGYRLPLGGGALAPHLALSYAAPRTRAEAAADERLPGDGVMSYDIVHQQLVLTLGGRYHLPFGPDIISPYVSAGARLYLTRTRVDAGAGGEDFGYNEETDTRAGLLVAAGTEVSLGPGAALIELGLGYAKVEGYVLRETSAGALLIAAGYRFTF